MAGAGSMIESTRRDLLRLIEDLSAKCRSVGPGKSLGRGSAERVADSWALPRRRIGPIRPIRPIGRIERLKKRRLHGAFSSAGVLSIASANWS